MNVHVERLTGVYKNLTIGVVALVFRCTPLDLPDLNSVEALAVRWADLDEIPDLMAPAYAARITDAFGDFPATRAHNGIQLVTG
jgi:hypothetical protein